MSDARRKLTEDIRPRTKNEIIEFVRVEEIHRKQQEVKEKIKAKKEQLQHEKEKVKEEQKRMINREVGTLKAMADDEGKGASRYRDAAKDTPLPTLSKLLFILASEEQTHEQRLRMLAAELERGIL